MTHLDLFTGIGGFHIAAEWAGFQTVGFSEIESYCCKLLAEKWPDIRNYGDLRTADFSRVGAITVLSAGVPCQPASLAGKRKGSSDARWLWPATLDVVGSVKSAWAVFENPSGILSLGEFETVLIRLGDLGYQVRLFSVPANAVGADHLRQRVFIVAQSNRDRGQRRGSEWRGQVGTGTYAETEGSGEDANTLADAEYRREPERTWQTRRSSRQRTPERQFIGSDVFRITQPPLCRRADGIQNRSHRLKALGNAVVPQQAYPFFAAVAQTERELA